MAGPMSRSQASSCSDGQGAVKYERLDPDQETGTRKLAQICGAPPQSDHIYTARKAQRRALQREANRWDQAAKDIAVHKRKHLSRQGMALLQEEECLLRAEAEKYQQLAAMLY